MFGDIVQDLRRQTARRMHPGEIAGFIKPNAFLCAALVHAFVQASLH